jgi:predicted TIM-barrel fold metal-dependent hydrolase
MLLGAGLFITAAAAFGKPLPPPVIDMHLHAYRVGAAAGARSCPGDQRPNYPAIDLKAPFDPSKMAICAHPLVAAASDEELMRRSIAALDKFNVRHAVTSGDVANVARWSAAEPDRIIPALGFADGENIAVDEYRRLYEAKKFQVFAEVETQYEGVDAGDARWEPYFALAEQLDIPVGIHFGEGPPAGAWFPGYEKYRPRLTSTFQLDDVLYRHPRLRIYAMHYGSPLVEDTIAMMFTHPNLYVDVAMNDWSNPRAQFYDDLKRLVQAGFEKRIMFGSDQMYWPDAVGEAIHSINAAPFLTRAEKRDILYNNAARFLGLSAAQIKADNQR